MKRLILFAIINTVLTLGYCQPHNCNRKDTILCMCLKDDRGVQYELVQTIDLKNNYWIDSTRKIIILYNTNKAIIHLPVPDEDVKNFSVDGINKKYNGFKIITSQGGGPFIIRRYFYFRSNHNQIYLHKIVSEFLNLDSKRKKKDIAILHPRLQITEIDLIQFL